MKAAHVRGIDGDVGAIRPIGRPADLDLILLARLIHAAAEIHDRLFLLNTAQRVRKRLQRLETAIGIENVELGVVRCEGRTSVRRALGVARGAFLEPLTTLSAEAIDRRG